MFENLCSKSSTYQHWGVEPFVKEVRSFMRNALNAPPELLQYEEVLKMITFMFPCRARKLDPEAARKQRALLVQVFQENNSKLRTDLFSDPLVKFLWSKVWIVESPETVT